MAPNSDATRQILFSETSDAVTELPTGNLEVPHEWLDKNISAIPKPNAIAKAALHQALDQAGLSIDKLSTLRVGICIGSTSGGANYQDAFNRDFHLGKMPEPTPLLEYFSNNTAQWLARELKLSGPILMINNACTSGADAVGLGAQWLRADLCDMVICGGTEAIYPFMQFGFRSLMLTSNHRCKPFDRNRQGLNLGEGAGILILEKASTPRSKRAQVLGYGSASDAYHPTTPHPEGRGLNEAVRRALKGIETLKIDFVNAHGTGTPHNDLVEGKWIKSHFPGSSLVATKGFTGHTLGASGAIEAILTVMSLEDQILPKSIGFSEIDPVIGLSPTTETTQGHFKTALSFSLGFGGTNSALCLGHELSGRLT